MAKERPTEDGLQAKYPELPNRLYRAAVHIENSSEGPFYFRVEAERQGRTIDFELKYLTSRDQRRWTDLGSNMVHFPKPKKVELVCRDREEILETTELDRIRTMMEYDAEAVCRHNGRPLEGNVLRVNDLFDIYDRRDEDGNLYSTGALSAIAEHVDHNLRSYHRDIVARAMTEQFLVHQGIGAMHYTINHGRVGILAQKYARENNVNENSVLVKCIRGMKDRRPKRTRIHPLFKAPVWYKREQVKELEERFAPEQGVLFENE